MKKKLNFQTIEIEKKKKGSNQYSENDYIEYKKKEVNKRENQEESSRYLYKPEKLKFCILYFHYALSFQNGQ